MSKRQRMRRQAAGPVAAVAIPESGRNAKPADFSEIGSSGLKHSGGFLQEERLLDLKGSKGKAKFREMADKDALIGACLGYIKALIRQVRFYVDPYSVADSEDVKKAAFVNECFNDMSTPFPEFIGEALSMLTFGFAPHEMVYKRRLGDTNDGETRSKYSDGLIGFRKLPLRAQTTVTRWDIDDNGGIHGFWQNDPGGKRRGEVYIPISKALLFRPSSEKNNPEGRSLLQNAYEAYYYASKLGELEAMGFERDATGIPVMQIPVRCMLPNANPADAAVYEGAKNIVKNIKQDKEGGIVLPSDFSQTGQQMYELKLLTTGGKRQFDATLMIKRYKQDMAMALLSDFVLLGHESVGSYALSTDKTNLFTLALGAFADSIVEVLNLYGIPRLMAVNGWDTTRCPVMKRGDVEQVSLAALGDYVTKITGAGVKMFQDLEAHLLKAAKLPARPATIYGADGNPPVNLDAAGLPFDKKVESAGQLVRAGYAPDDAAASVGLPPMEHIGLPPVTVQTPRDAGDTAPPPVDKKGDDKEDAA